MNELRQSFAFAAAAAFLLLALPATAIGQWRALEQIRSIETFLLAVGCGEPPINESHTTDEPGLFQARAINERGCDRGFGASAIAQRSYIGDEVMRGVGAAQSRLGNLVGSGVYSFNSSSLSCTFEVTETTEISLSGLVTTRSTIETANAGAIVRLARADRTPVFEAVVSAPPDGERLTERFDERLTLERGRYVLTGYADALLFAAVGPDHIGDSVFRFDMRIVNN